MAEEVTLMPGKEEKVQKKKRPTAQATQKNSKGELSEKDLQEVTAGEAKAGRADF